MGHNGKGCSRRLWIVTSAPGIGGAQRRAAKLAAYVASRHLFSEVILLVNSRLKEQYQQDSEIMGLLEDSSARLESTLAYGYREWISHELKERTVKKLDQWGGFVGRLPRPYRLLLRSLSWLGFLDRLVGDSDVVHCFGGDIARNGCLFLAMSRSTSIVLELPGNNFLPRLSRQMAVLAVPDQEAPALVIKAVSETVYENFIGRFPGDYFTERRIRVSPWSGPFIFVPPANRPVVKEKVIVFASRFQPKKNPVLFARAVRRLLDAGELDGWRIKIRGRGELEGEINNTVRPYLASGVVDVRFSYQLADELASSRILVSLIETGNYPSQSIFEAMNHGNVLLLSRTGNTLEHYDHPDVLFTDLDEDSVVDGVRRAVVESLSPEFERKSEAMRAFFNEIVAANDYVDELLSLYEIIPSSEVTALP